MVDLTDLQRAIAPNAPPAQVGVKLYDAQGRIIGPLTLRQQDYDALADLAPHSIIIRGQARTVELRQPGAKSIYLAE